MNTRTYFLFVFVLLAGCESAPPGARPGPYVKPGLVMIPADQAPLYGISSAGPSEGGMAPRPPTGYAATDVRSVQTEAQVSAIQYNRYVDPARPNELMHEAHIVYRREGPPRWRLQPATAEQQILIGPGLTEGRGEVRPLASQELDAYLREQRVNIQKQQQVVGQMTEGMRQLAEQQRQLAKELSVLRAASPGSSPAEPAKQTKPETIHDSSATISPPLSTESDKPVTTP